MVARKPDDETQNADVSCRMTHVIVVTLLAATCVAGLAGMAAATGVRFSTVSRDPATALGGPFVTGYLSYIGAWLWCAAATSTLLAWFVLRPGPGAPGDGNGNARRFLLHTGLLTALLGGDDLFMLHDGLVPYVIADLEHALLAVYGLALAALLVIHRGQIPRTNRALLAASLGFFALSSLVDAGILRIGEDRRHLFEDGFKFLGIANWAAWVIAASAESLRRPRSEEATAAVDASFRRSRQLNFDWLATRWVWPKRVGITLAVLGACVSLAGAVGQWLRHGLGVGRSFGFIHQFGPDVEANLATWFAATIMLLCAALLGYAGLRESSKWARRRWWGLAAVFVVMSADETAQLHEMTIAPLRTVVGGQGVLYFSWVVPGILFAALVAAVSIKFLRSLPRHTCWLFLASGGIYLSGCLGVEMAGGWYAERAGVESLGYALLSCTEETLELAGLILFAYALCDHAWRATTSAAVAPQPIPVTLRAAAPVPMAAADSPDRVTSQFRRATGPAAAATAAPSHADRS